METESVGITGQILTQNGVEIEDVPGSGVVSRILIRDTGIIHVVKVRDVEWIHACRNYVEIHAGGKTFLHRETLGRIAGRLPAPQFVKIQRSSIVNAHKVREVRTVGKGHYSLTVSSGVELPTNRALHEIHDVIMAA
jgi:two-component system, LytTR family, response regulator